MIPHPHWAGNRNAGTWLGHKQEYNHSLVQFSQPNSSSRCPDVEAMKKIVTVVAADFLLNQWTGNIHINKLTGILRNSVGISSRAEFFCQHSAEVFFVRLKGEDSNIISPHLSWPFAVSEYNSLRSQLNLYENVKLLALMYGHTLFTPWDNSSPKRNSAHKGLWGDLWKGKEIHQNWRKVFSVLLKKSEILHDKFSLFYPV